MNVRAFLLVLFVTVASSRQTQLKKIVTEGAEDSSFSCQGRITGYYADVETGCRTYHYCNGDNQYSYACPNNTLFQQRIFICNHWYLVDCNSSEQHYGANLLIGQRDRAFIGDDDITSSLFAGETGGAVQTTESETGVGTDEEGIQSVEEDRTQPTQKATNRTGKSDFNDGNELGSRAAEKGFVKLRFSDRRELFYIPNGNGSRSGFPASYREFLIPRTWQGTDLMRFRDDNRGPGDVACPKYCDRRFVRPNTCHPCIMIK